MSVFALPLDMPARARALLYASLMVVDSRGVVEPSGTPPRAMKTLMTLCGVTRRNIERALVQLRRFDLVETARAHHALTVRIKLEQLRVMGGCEVCGNPARGTGRFCAFCKQREGRDDREWQIRAIELFGAGLSPPRIAARLRMPLFVARAEDGREAGGGAVVPFLVSHPDLREWREREAWSQRLREMDKGSGIEE